MKILKNMLIFLVTVKLILSLGLVSFAAEIEGRLDAQVFIEQIFTITATPPSIDFGNIDPDPDSVTDVRGVDVYCQTNNNNPWEVRIILLSPLSSDVFTIPDENITWQVTSSGSGTLYSEGGIPVFGEPAGGSLHTTPIVFYSSADSELVTPSPIEFNFQFSVAIPENQAAGIYSTTMVLTLVETATSDPSMPGDAKTQTIGVTLEVNPKFTMSVTPSSLNFGTVVPGRTSGAKELSIACVTNNNNPWSVSVHATSELISGITTIPNENFYWAVLQTIATAYGEVTAYGDDKTMSLTPDTCYRSSIDEYVTSSPAEISLRFKVNVPSLQEPGRYITTLVLTMVEEQLLPPPPPPPPPPPI